MMLSGWMNCGWRGWSRGRCLQTSILLWDMSPIISSTLGIIGLKVVVFILGFLWILVVGKRLLLIVGVEAKFLINFKDNKL